MDERRYRRRGGFAWPLILIALGVIFLLSNLGMLNWNMWDLIWRLWPVLLIAIGLDILFGRRSALGSLIVLVLIIVLIGGVVWFAVTASPLVTGETLTTDQVVQSLSGATSADMQISFGAGTLRMGALKDSPNLIEGSVATGPGETITRDFRLDGSVAHFELRSQGVPSIAFGRHVGEATWSLDLSSSVPMSLRVGTGVGESQIDLSGLQVTDLNVNSGVGQMQLQLPARGRVQAKVSGGIGQIVVTIPEGMAARIHGSAGLSGLTVSSRFASQGGGQYVSSNYATAEDRVDLDISGGIGQVVIR